MSGPRATDFDQLSEPLPQRIAVALSKLGLAMKQQQWQQAAGDGLSPTQGQILATVLAEGARTVSELAQRLGVTLATTSDAARVLVDKGLLVRSPDPRNHRASLLALTDGGRERAARASAWPEFLGAAVAELAPHEQPVFLAGLLKMIRALQQAGMIPPQRMCISCVYFRAHAHAGARPHHCDLVGAPMAAAHLRIDCGEHEPASDAHADVTWQRFVAPR